MARALLKRQVCSKEEYLKLEEHNEYKSEFHDGEIFDMAGGSYKHSAIISNLHRRIGNLLDGKDYMLFDSNLKLAIPKHNSFVYPDMIVVCGKIEFYANQNDIILNPVLIVEVLSPSTESFDRGGKFEYYRALASLAEYVLVSQKEYIVETYFKQNEKTWLYSVAKGLEESIVLQSLSIGIVLKEMFEQFTLVTLQDNHDIFALSFINNQQAVGYDINSEPIRQSAIERARASNRMAVTSPILLVQEQKKRVGLLELLTFVAIIVALGCGDPRGISASLSLRIGD